MLIIDCNCDANHCKVTIINNEAGKVRYGYEQTRHPEFKQEV